MTSPAVAPAPRHGWRIGSLAGTPVYIARSWPIIAVVIVALFGPNLGRPGRSDTYGYFVAGGYALLLLVSVLVHEASHSLAAQARGHKVDRIVADVWGGHTVYDATRTSPTTTALVAVAGPLSNLVLAGIAWLVLQVVTNETAMTLLEITALANVYVGLFNLLPGLPLDGGQIVSALTWRATGRRGVGLTVAGWLGRAVAVGAFCWYLMLPLVMGERPRTSEVVIAVAIGVFLWQGASQAIRAGEIHEATAAPVDTVIEGVTLVPGDTPVAELPRLAMQGSAGWVAASDAAGWPFALLDSEAAASVPAAARETTSVSTVVSSQPVEWVVSVPPDAVLTDLVRIMTERDLTVAILIDEATREVKGLVTADRLNQVIGAELERRRRR